MPLQPDHVTSVARRVGHAMTMRASWSFCAIAVLCLSHAACAPGEAGKDRSSATQTTGSQPAPTAAAATPADSLAVARTVERFDSLLVAGDSSGALALLAPDALVLESGGMETREQYRSHHLPGDIEFVRAVRATGDPVRVVVRGDVAWTVATSITKAPFTTGRSTPPGRPSWC